MKNKQPLISIVMPVYNAGDFLHQTIKSILNQTHQNWELIAIDDHSKDNSLEILKNYAKKDKRIKMTEEEESLFGIDKLNIKRSSIPAVTHVDYSSRIQTVHKETNLKYHKLITKFKEKTGCSVVVNTSFNVRGEPIVCTPEDAFRCFMGTELDLLVVGNCVLKKEKQSKTLIEDYKDKYELD